MKTTALERERVRRHTAAKVNHRVDEEILAHVRHHAGASEEELSARIAALDREWDIERALETNASVLALTGLGLGFFKRAWLAVPAVVLPFLLLHGTQGWCPPLPLMRRAGVRTRSEIERERFALKFLRGDFDGIDRQSVRRSPETLLAMASR